MIFNPLRGESGPLHNFKEMAPTTGKDKKTRVTLQGGAEKRRTTTGW
jgi:hypothetical protein